MADLIMSPQRKKSSKRKVKASAWVHVRRLVFPGVSAVTDKGRNELSECVFLFVSF